MFIRQMDFIFDYCGAVFEWAIFPLTHTLTHTANKLYPKKWTRK